MIRIRKGTVTEILRADHTVQELRVDVEGASEKAVAYPQLTGAVSPGCEVLLNTTAVALSLGSGGAHFVIANLSAPERGLSPGPGHIMKLNYTPLQCRVLSCEEQDSPHHETMKHADTLRGAPVVCATLHSMVAPVAAAIHELTNGKARTAYVMTDAACLALPFSRTVKQLKEKGLLIGTATYGQALGGDADCVNKFTALLACRHILGADIIIAAMGVGSIGTGTPLGHSAMEQAELLNAAAALHGAPLALPRMSFADPRPRHQGISHHTLSALAIATFVNAALPLPLLPPVQAAQIKRQIADYNLAEKFHIQEFDGAIAAQALQKHGLRITTMGRTPDQDPAFFLACGAAAHAAVQLLRATAD
jgi:hypothetical protein